MLIPIVFRFGYGNKFILQSNYVFSKIQLARKYFFYYLGASNGKGHGIHSPFVFDFIIHVLNDKEDYPAYKSVEQLRKRLLKDKTLIEIKDLGAGSNLSKTKRPTVAAVVKNAAKPKKYAQLIYRIANYYQPKKIIELGSSLGLSTAYLSLASPAASVFTLEGSETIADYAENNFRKLNLSNIRLIKGNFDETLGPVLEETGFVELAFIDGNHRKEPTLTYLNQLLQKAGDSCIFIFDDIHWSAGMEMAWNQIKQDPRVLLTVDLFVMGLVFFNKDFRYKQEFTIWF
jgi:predicted O-methyltransferase YrrM